MTSNEKIFVYYQSCSDVSNHALWTEGSSANPRCHGLPHVTNPDIASSGSAPTARANTRSTDLGLPLCTESTHAYAHSQQKHERQSHAPILHIHPQIDRNPRTHVTRTCPEQEPSKQERPKQRLLSSCRSSTSTHSPRPAWCHREMHLNKSTTQDNPQNMISDHYTPLS